jgi:trk system potassium uptake protein TrkH
VLIRPDSADLRVIGLYTGRVITAMGAVLLVPAALGALLGEYNEALAFVLSAGIAVGVGQLGEWRLATRDLLDWNQALVVVALSWLVGALVAAMPLYLSGHYADFLDAYFEGMSGIATIGLTVVNDLDHLSYSVNFWRHLTQFIGGQGLVLIALSLFTGGGGLAGLYVGEGREDRILPNVVRTARFIWKVALFYGAVAVSTLWAAMLHAGLPSWEALFHATVVFMAAFDTGGFAPTSASIGFYHSPLVQAVVAVLMVAGALSFALHIHHWRRRSGELWRSLEARVLAATFLGLFALAAVSLISQGIYEDHTSLMRQGFFQMLSAHTTTGFNTVPARLFVTDWGPLAPAAIVIAMAIGGMAGSTAGGIKGLRLGLTLKSVGQDVRRLLLPSDAVVVQTYQANGQRRALRPELARSAVVLLLLYVLLYLAGALAGMFYGYSLEEAVFESVAAASSGGFSIGIVGPAMPQPLQAIYIAQMWIGRLEFVAALALLGWLWSAARGSR